VFFHHASSEAYFDSFSDVVMIASQIALEDGVRNGFNF